MQRSKFTEAVAIANQGYAIASVPVDVNILFILLL